MILLEIVYYFPVTSLTKGEKVGEWRVSTKWSTIERFLDKPFFFIRKHKHVYINNETNTNDKKVLVQGKKTKGKTEKTSSGLS